LAPAADPLITCAHIVANEQGQRASRVFVSGNGIKRYEAELVSVDESYDLASLKIGEGKQPSKGSSELPEVGEQVIFAGQPAGVAKLSVFPGMTSAAGPGLLSKPSCDLIQIAGMVNNGNSGGPLVNAEGKILGVITAKYVPLLCSVRSISRRS